MDPSPPKRKCPRNPGNIKSTSPTRFEVHYLGGNSDSGTLDARTLGVSVIGISDLVTGLARELNIPKPPVRIEAKLERGSVIIHFALLLLQDARNFLTANETLLVALAALVDVVSKSGRFIGRSAGWLVPQLRKAYAQMINSAAQSAEE